MLNTLMYLIFFLFDVKLLQFFGSKIIACTGLEIVTSEEEEIMNKNRHFSVEN